MPNGSLGLDVSVMPNGSLGLDVSVIQAGSLPPHVSVMPNGSLGLDVSVNLQGSTWICALRTGGFLVVPWGAWGFNAYETDPA